jgi:hypothetical protein
MEHVNVSTILDAMPVAMTRREKFIRWAELVRKTPHRLRLYSNLEDLSRLQLRQFLVRFDGSAMGVAAADPIFQSMGLSESSSLTDVLQFFTMNLDQAHAFSCDCGGTISNEEQALRIEHIGLSKVVD